MKHQLCERLQNAFDAMSILNKPNWDSYGASPIEEKTIENAKEYCCKVDDNNYIEALPYADGTIHLYYKRILEAVVSPASIEEYYFKEDGRLRMWVKYEMP